MLSHHSKGTANRVVGPVLAPKVQPRTSHAVWTTVLTHGALLWLWIVKALACCCSPRILRAHVSTISGTRPCSNSMQGRSNWRQRTKLSNSSTSSPSPIPSRWTGTQSTSRQCIWILEGLMSSRLRLNVHMILHTGKNWSIKSRHRQCAVVIHLESISSQTRSRLKVAVTQQALSGRLLKANTSMTRTCRKLSSTLLSSDQLN